MTQGNDVSVSEASSLALNKLVELTEQLTTKLVEVAPEALEALLTLIQIRGGFYIVIGFLSALLSFFCFKNFRKWIEKAAEDDDPFSAIGIILFSIASTSIAFVFLMNFNYWISLLYPEGRLVLIALESAGINLKG